MRTGREVAEKYFREIVISGLDISPLTQESLYHADLLRAKYKEKLPWGGCIVAATAVRNKAKLVVTEDPHFAESREIEARRVTELHSSPS